MNLSHIWSTIFRRVTPAELAAQELADAEIALLNALSGRDYATAISAYNETRIKRLREFLAQEVKEKA